jgi:hypothetical protein
MKAWFLSLGIVSAIFVSVSALAYTGLPYVPLDLSLQVNPYSPPGVSAVAQGSLNPVQIPNASLEDSMVNGDFVIKRTGGTDSTLGNGWDEATTWVFDFTSDPRWGPFSTSKSLASARLTLTLTPKSSLVIQDIIRIEGLADISTAQIQALPINTTGTVELKLLDFYSSVEILNVLTSDIEGQIPMFYADDASISFAELRLVSGTPPKDDSPVVGACPGSVPGQESAPEILHVTPEMAPNNSLIFDFNVELDQLADVWVEYHPAEEPGSALRSSLSKSPDTIHNLQVMRLRPETTYCYQVFATAADSIEPTGPVSDSFPGSFTTGPIPPGLVGASFSLISGKQTYDLTILDFNDQDFAGFVAIDGDAEIVWYYEHESRTFAVDQDDNHNLVFGQLNGVKFIEIEPDGTVVNEISDTLDDGSICSPAGRWHHESLIQPGGEVYFLSSEIQGIEINGEARQQTGDTVAVWDRSAGTVSTLFSLFNFFNPVTDRTPASDTVAGFYWRGCDAAESSDDWTHANSLWKDDQGNLIVSIRHLNQIISVSSDTNSLQWRLGGPGSDFSFPDAGNQFYHQHTAQRLPNGNILLFDNGNVRPVSEGGQFSRALELELDFASMEARKVWEYRFSPDLFAGCCSSVERLTNGNTVLVFGATSVQDTCCRTFTLVEADGAGDTVAVIEVSSPGKEIQYRAKVISSINGELTK